MIMSKAPDPEISEPDTSEPSLRKLPTKPRRRQLIKPQELVVAAIFIAVVAVLLITLINKLVLDRDIVNARAVSSKVVVDIQKRDGNAIWSLGSPEFQKSYTPASLTRGFQSVAVATLKTPTLVDQISDSEPSGRTIYFVYEYTALKVPFYVRTGIQQESGHWYLTGIAGNIDESDLTGN